MSAAFPNPSPGPDPAARPRPMRTQQARGLLTTGIVGGWLTASAWAIATLVILFAVFAAAKTEMGGFDFAFGAGMFVLLALFVWLGGMVCTIVGWFGMATLHRGMGRLMAWLSIVVTALAVIVPSSVPTMGSKDSVVTLALVSMAVWVGYYVLNAIFWATRGRARGLARLSVVGSIITATAVAIMMVLGVGNAAAVSELTLIVLIAAPFGAVLAHLGCGLAMGRERQTAQELASFD